MDIFLIPTIQLMIPTFQRLIQNFTEVPCDGNQNEFGRALWNERNDLRRIFNALGGNKPRYELYLTDSMGDYVDPTILYNPDKKDIDENFLMYDMRLKELLTRLDYQNSNIKKLEFLNLNDIDTTIIGSTNTQTFECDNVRTRCRCFNKEFQLPSQEQLDNQGLIVPPVNLRSALKTG